MLFRAWRLAVGQPSCVRCLGMFRCCFPSFFHRDLQSPTAREDSHHAEESFSPLRSESLNWLGNSFCPELVFGSPASLLSCWFSARQLASFALDTESNSRRFRARRRPRAESNQEPSDPKADALPSRPSSSQFCPGRTRQDLIDGVLVIR